MLACNSRSSSSGANSTSTCRHMPHGGVGSSASVAMTRMSKPRTPRATAAASAALRTDTRRIRRVLDVAAFDDAAVRRQQRRADAEVRVRRVGALHRGECPSRSTIRAFGVARRRRGRRVICHATELREEGRARGPGTRCPSHSATVAPRSEKVARRPSVTRHARGGRPRAAARTRARDRSTGSSDRCRGRP